MRRCQTHLLKHHRNPETMSALERNPEVPGSAPDEDLDPGTNWRGMPRDPSQFTWRLDFREATRTCPGCPRRNSRGIPYFLQQLEKNRKILLSLRDVALFLCGVVREIPPSFLSLERFLDTLDATHEIPQHTLLHWKGTPSVPPLLKESTVFLSSSRDDGPIPCFVGKGIPAFLSHLKRR